MNLPQNIVYLKNRRDTSVFCVFKKHILEQYNIELYILIKWSIVYIYNQNKT